MAVAMEDAVEGLPLVAAAQRIGIGGIAPSQAADVAADRPLGYDGRRAGSRRRVAAVVDIDDLGPRVARAQVELDQSLPGGVVGRIGNGQVETDSLIQVFLFNLR